MRDANEIKTARKKWSREILGARSTWKTVTAYFARSISQNTFLCSERIKQKRFRPIKCKSRSNAGSGLRPDRNLRKASIHRFIESNVLLFYGFCASFHYERQIQLTCYWSVDKWIKFSPLVLRILRVYLLLYTNSTLPEQIIVFCSFFFNRFKPSNFDKNHTSVCE